ncbi:MAG: DUF2274 domain-containing protein [Rhizomicrobium sp.]
MKLGKLPDRTPVKIAMTISPELNRMLQEYAAFYAKAYGSEETVAELCPYMLQAFMDADKGFQKARKSVEAPVSDGALSSPKRTARATPNPVSSG